MADKKITQLTLDSSPGVDSLIETIDDPSGSATNKRATLQSIVDLVEANISIKLDDLATPDDNTDLNATTGHHGLLKKLDGNAAHFLDGNGGWSTPTGSGGDVSGQSSSVDGEVALFSGTGGKTIKRATGSGIVRVASGVYGTPGNVNLASEVTGDLPLSNLAQSSAASKLLGRGSASGGGDFQEISVGTGLTMSGTTLQKAADTRAISVVIDGGGSAITTGVKADISVPFACTITGVRLLADQSGSIVVDVWKDTYANYPPTNADSITASAKPTISSATKAEDTTLTGWTTSISAGDTLRFNVDSASTVQRVTLTLTITVP
jgi:hypothetical protein